LAKRFYSGNKWFPFFNRFLTS